MKGQKKRRTASPVAMAVLSSLCAALWFFRIFLRGENDALTVCAGIIWTACAAVWGFRAAREWKASVNKEGDL